MPRQYPTGFLDGMIRPMIAGDLFHDLLQTLCGPHRRCIAGNTENRIMMGLVGELSQRGATPRVVLQCVTCPTESFLV